MEYKDAANQEKSSWIEHTTDIAHRLFKSLHSNETTITVGCWMSLVILLGSTKNPKPILYGSLLNKLCSQEVKG